MTSTLLYDHKRDALNFGEAVLIYEDGTTERVMENDLCPKAESAEQSVSETKESWSPGGQILFLFNYAWGLTSELESICLGSEAAVKRAIANPKLRSFSPEINAIIALECEIQKELENGESTYTAKVPSSIRSKPARAFKRRAANPKQTTAGKRATLHPTGRKKPGISGRRHPRLVETATRNGVETLQNGVETPDSKTILKRGINTPLGDKTPQKTKGLQGVLFS